MANNSGASRRAQRAKQQQRNHRNRIIFATLAVVAVVGIIALFLTSGSSDDDGVATVDVDMFEFGFAGELSAPAGTVRISATNTGRINHNIGIRGGPITNEVGPGVRVQLELDDLALGTYELYCDISGHAASGMTAALVITEAPAT